MVKASKGGDKNNNNDNNKNKHNNSNDQNHKNDAPLNKKSKTNHPPHQNDDPIDSSTIESILDTVWKHYCDYFFTDHPNDNDDDDDSDGETDQLVEILDLIRSKIPKAMKEVWEFPPSTTTNTPNTTSNKNSNKSNNNKKQKKSTASTIHSNNDKNKNDIDWSQRRPLLPLLISVTCTLLADECIEEYMDIETLISMASTTTTTTTTTNDSTPTDPTVGGHRDVKKLQAQKWDVLNQIRQHLLQAIQSFPNNASALQMSTNYLRMTRTTTASLSSSSSSRFHIAKLYTQAADAASQVRSMAVRLMMMEHHDDPVVSEEVQEWIVALLLNQVCGVDEVEEEEVDDDDDEKEDKVEDDERANSILWSSSKVEGMSRYMSTMMYSMCQEHDLALEQLQALGITHRLHPQLWQTALPQRRRDPPVPSRNEDLHGITLSSSSVAESAKHNTTSPMSFRGTATTAGVIPQHLYDRLCHIFQPGADYWYRSSYTSRGYFSFYLDLPTTTTTTLKPATKSKKTKTTPSKKHTARNVIDDVVCNYLLPLVQQQQKSKQGTNSNKDQDETIVGYEWWVHTRAMTANLGHNLHFDTDEALLRRNGTVSHPCISSVLYLTGGSDNNNNNDNSAVNDEEDDKNSLYCQGGPTIILNQTPDSTTNADRVWYSHPINNSFMTFPGNLLHGVLPCLGPTSTTDEDVSSASMTNDEPLSETLIQLLSEEVKPDPTKTIKTTSSHDDMNRLTLMIGFWTRNVPGDMDPELTDEDRLYGPCSPLPSINDTQWVRELCEGYNTNDTRNSSTLDVVSNTTNIVSVPLPCVAPAWEEITNTNDSNQPSTQVTMAIPRDVDHRFFVVDAPHCFKTQLTEAEQCDDASVYYSMIEDDAEEEEDDDE